MKKIVVSAPGKLHLLGEHAVVYGKKALVTAVNRRCFVTLKERIDDKISFTASDFSATFLLTEKQIIIKTILSKARWEKFAKEEKVELLKKICPTILDFAAIAVGESILQFRKKMPSGFSLEVLSEIPMGVGMGSSAALSVAIAGALSIFLTGKLQKNLVNNIAYETEKKQHGFPSGSDNTASCFGGFLLYTKNGAEASVKNLSLHLSQKIQSRFFIINTGSPKETTGEMVTFVKKHVARNKERMEEIFQNQEVLVEKLEAALQNNETDAIPEILKRGEKNLESMGVVSNTSKKIIREIEKLKSCAKVCGGGGISGPTGILLAFANNAKKIQHIAKKNNVPFDTVLLGEEGIREEK